MEFDCPDDDCDGVIDTAECAEFAGLVVCPECTGMKRLV